MTTTVEGKTATAEITPVLRGTDDYHWLSGETSAKTTSGTAEKCADKATFTSSEDPYETGGFEGHAYPSLPVSLFHPVSILASAVPCSVY